MTYERKMHNFTIRLCMGKLYPMSVPIFSGYTPVLPLAIPLQAYQHIIETAGFFRKLLNPAYIGMIKVMAGMDKEMLGKISDVTVIENGLVVVSLRSIMGEETTKILPVIEDYFLTKLTVFYLLLLYASNQVVGV